MSEVLPLVSVIGFSSNVPGGLIVHPDGDTVIYPLGSTIVLRSKSDSSKQQFLRGHTHEVSCVAVSNNGKYLASGQKTFMGFKADIIVWDLETQQLHKKLSLHNVMVQSLAFSHDSKKIASLGGPDDGSLALWDVTSGEAICGSPADNCFVQCVRFFNKDSKKLVTAGQGNIHVWEYVSNINKLRSMSMELGKLVRHFMCVSIADDDSCVYAGTKSGDLLQLNLKRNVLRNTGPKNHLPGGIAACSTTPHPGLLLLGTGDGALSLMNIPTEESKKRVLNLGIINSIKLHGGVTSISIDSSGQRHGKVIAYVGTNTSNIYQVVADLQSGHLAEQLVQSAHCSAVTAIAFPELYGEVFATSAYAEIRLWHIHTGRELLRIKVPNVGCYCIAFSTDGSAILSGWSDGKIRAFGPQSGKLLYTIDAHLKAVNAIAATHNPKQIISGGEEGMVRIWEVSERGAFKMLASMKDHKAAVNAIAVSPRTGAEAVSASSDGCCIVWDLDTMKRRTSVYSNTFFKSVAYLPDESQIVTTGSDRKIAYWDAYDGSAVRVTDASEDAAMSDLHVDSRGEAIISCGADSLVQLWGYDEGHCFYTGIGHSGTVNRVRVSPDSAQIVSVGSEGGIFIWKYMKPGIGDLVNVPSNSAKTTMATGGLDLSLAMAALNRCYLPRLKRVTTPLLEPRMKIID